MDWTPEDIDRLRREWASGKSTAQIAVAMGISKNAVVGKAHRLTLPPRLSPIRRYADGQRPVPVPRAGKVTLPPLIAAADPRPVAVAPVPEQRRPIAQAAPEPIAEAVEPASAPIRIGPAEPCCWPIGEPGTCTFRYCDDDAEPRRPYCARHAALARARRQPVDDADMVAAR